MLQLKEGFMETNNSGVVGFYEIIGLNKPADNNQQTISPL